MPRGIPANVLTELNKAQVNGLIYLVRVKLKSGTRYWAERDGIVWGGNTYSGRVITIGSLGYDVDDATQVQITLANADGLITTLDRTESFIGAKVEVIEYIDSIADGYVKWVGWSDELSQLTGDRVTLTAYAGSPTTNTEIPKRNISIQCNNEFGKFDAAQTVTDFDGCSCPYNKTASIGFRTTTVGAIDGTSDPVTFSVNPLPNSQLFIVSNELLIDNERLLVISTDGANQLTCSRAQRGTVKASHGGGSAILFGNCAFSVAECQRRGMYGNNSSDQTALSRNRNYFSGFPQITGYDGGFQRPKVMLRSKRLTYGGNTSAYDSAIPLVYGRARLVSPILILAEPNGSDFTSTLWATAEGPLATNATDESQATPSNAYLADSTPAQEAAGTYQGIFVNGAHRHDPRPGYGYEIYNGVMDQPEPGSSFFPNVVDFTTNKLAYYGTARVAFRISAKNNPTTDFKTQSFNGQFDIAYGRIVRVYPNPYVDATTYTRKATTNGAWVLADLLTSRRAGGGTDWGRVNLSSFVTVAARNDATVTDTLNGGSVPRWTFNGAITDKKSYQDWIRLVCLQMYCLPPFLDINGQLKLKVLSAGSATGTYSSNSASARNIMWKGGQSTLVKSRQPISNIPNEIRVNFIDKASFAKVQLIVADRFAQKQVGDIYGDNSLRVVSKTIDLPGTGTQDEAARIATLILRAGEFANGGLANNLQVQFDTFYKDSDLEQGDIISVTDDLLDPTTETTFRVMKIEDRSEKAAGGGIVFVRTITATLHNDAIYDDTAATVTRFDRIAANTAFDAEPPAVTSYSVAEAGAYDGNNKLVARLTFNYTEPNPKQNFRSVVIMRSPDVSGAPDPNGWRDVLELNNPNTTIDYPVSGALEWFCALSRPMSGHLPDPNTLDAAGNPKYPRQAVLVNGVTDVLPAPTNFNLFINTSAITLRWDKYTGDNLKLFKSFYVFRNTTNSIPATPIAHLDGSTFVDTSVNPSTTYYYWVKGFSILNAEGTATASLNTTSPAGAGSDSSTPTAPTTGVIRSLGSFNTNEYHWTIGVDIPGGATNWNTIYKTTIQVATDSGFSSLVLNQTYQFKPPFTIDVKVATPGTYYFRAKVTNPFGDSAWGTTLSRDTNFGDNISADTTIPPAPDNLAMITKSGSTNNQLGGNEFLVSWTIPNSQTGSYWGYSVFVHDSSTLPTSTKYYNSITDSKTISLKAGSTILTISAATTWTSDELAGKDIVVFHTSRGGSPTFDYEGAMFICKILHNDTTTITVDMPAERMTRTISGCNFFVITAGGGNHFFEKLKFATPALINEGVLAMTEERGTRTRQVKFAAGVGTLYSWVALYNMLGEGKVAASPVNATFDGIATAEIKLLAVDNGRVASAAITYDKISVSQLDAINANVGTLTAGTISGVLLRTAASGARIEMDSTNGLRAFDGSGVLQSQLPVSGSNIAQVITTMVKGKSGSAAILEHGNASSGNLTISGSGGGTLIFSGSTNNATEFGRISSSGLGIAGSTVVNSSAQHTGDGSLLTSLSASNISSGTLAIARGGTNATSYQANALVYANGGASAFTSSSNLTYNGTDITFTNGAIKVSSGQGMKDTGSNSSFVCTSTTAQVYANGGTQVAEFGTGNLKLYVNSGFRTILTFNDGAGHNVLYY